MEINVKGLNELATKFNEFQVNAGFTDSNVAQRLMLTASEIFEAFEAYRQDHYALTKYENGNARNDLKSILAPHETGKLDVSKEYWFYLFGENVKDSFEDELADTLIRLLALCGERGIDIERHIYLKALYNELRVELKGQSYGGKKF